MPDRSKVKWSQLKVGLVAGGGFSILFVLVFLLTGSKGLFQRSAQLRTYMDDASGIADGTPVRLNGIAIGFLNKLQLTNSRDPKRTVEFDMQIQRQYLAEIPVDSVAGVAASNLLGDKFINITKGHSPKHIEDGGEVASLQAQDIPELMAQSANLLTTLKTILGRLDTMIAGVEAGKGNLGKFVKDEDLYNRLDAIASEGQQLIADVRTGHGTLSKLIYDGSLYDDLRSPLKRIDAMLDDVQAGRGTAGKMLKDPALYDEAKQTVAEIHALVADLNAGKGTAGKLLKDEQVHQRLNELVAKLNTTVDKINAGQGTIGQMMVNPALYDSLNGTTKEIQSLVKDMRANPKKFLTIRLSLF